MAGLSRSDAAPTTVALNDYIKLDGKYYYLNYKRDEYARDKSESENYKLLTYMGIAKELDLQEQKGQLIYDEENVYNVTLLCGLPPAHMEDPILKKNFKSYFKMAEPEQVTFKGRAWHIKINKVQVYAQCFAAIMTRFGEIKEYPKVFISYQRSR